MLIIVDSSSGICCASIVPAKGPHPFAVSFGCRFLDELGYQKMTMQTYGEDLITSWAKAVWQEWEKLQTGTADCVVAEKQLAIRTSTKEDHATTALVGATAQSIEGLTRTLRFAAERHLGMYIGPQSSLLPCVVRHAAYLLTKFRVRLNGSPAFEDFRSVDIESPILPLFEAVVTKHPGVLDRKLEEAWITGIWLGRSTDTNEHLVSSQYGVIRARTVRRLAHEIQWDKQLAEKVIWLPWAAYDASKTKQTPAWTPTEICQAFEEELQPIRRVCRRRNYTPAYRQGLPDEVLAHR